MEMLEGAELLQVNDWMCSCSVDNDIWVGRVQRVNKVSGEISMTYFPEVRKGYFVKSGTSWTENVQSLSLLEPGLFSYDRATREYHCKSSLQRFMSLGVAISAIVTDTNEVAHDTNEVMHDTDVLDDGDDGEDDDSGNEESMQWEGNGGGAAGSAYRYYKSFVFLKRTNGFKFYYSILTQTLRSDSAKLFC